MSKTTCPIVRTFGEIRGGGLYDDDCHTTTDRVIKMGGADGNEVVCDEISYYIMQKKIVLARFEVTPPTQAGTQHVYDELFASTCGKTYGDLYINIVSTVLRKEHVYWQFVNLVNLFGKIDQLVLARVNALVLRDGGRGVNVTLPDIYLLPNTDEIIVYRPDILRSVVQRLVGYINRLNVNSIMAKCTQATPIDTNIPEFSAALPDMTRVIPEIDLNTTHERVVASMHAALEAESDLTSYILEVEKYQCVMINIMNGVYDRCKVIVNCLTTG